MLQGLGKERFSRALQGKAAVALETWNRSDIAETTASWNSGIYANLCQVETSQNFIVKQDQQDGPQGNWSWLVHKIFPLDLQLAWFSSCWNPPSLTFMSGVGTAQPRRFQ